MAKGKKIVLDEEVPFDSLSDKGQYQAFQRAYGKENQAMLALIVLTVVWSYAAHVYGHATVFHCFTRSIMLVLCCFMLFHLLKQGHAMCERALAPAFTAARVTAAVPDFKPYSKPAAHKEKKKADKKDKPKRSKKISQAPDEPPVAAAPKPTPAVVPAVTPEPAAAVAQHKKRKEPSAVRNKKSLSAAQSAVEHAKAEALMATRALAESTMKHKKAEAAAHQAAQQARVTIRQTIKALPVQIPSPRPSMEDAIRPQEARKIAQDLPEPRAKLQRSPSEESADSAVSPSSATSTSPSSGVPRASYVPPHMREGYKRQAAVPPRAEHKKTGTTNSRRGRADSNQKRESVDRNTARPNEKRESVDRNTARPNEKRQSVDRNTARPNVGANNKFKKSNKEGNSKTNDIMQESMYLCLDTED